MKIYFLLGPIHDIAYFHRPGRPNLRNARRASSLYFKRLFARRRPYFRTARVENGNWHGFRIKGASLPPKRTLLPSFKGTTRFFSEKLWFFPLQSVWNLAILNFSWKWTDWIFWHCNFAIDSSFLIVFVS